MDQRSKLLQDEYEKRFTSNTQYRDSVWKVLCNDFFSRYISNQSVLLDLGAGWGEFSKNIQAGQKFAMDLNPECGRRIDGYAKFLHQDCATTWPLGNESLDVVFTSNFLEHLPSKSAIEATLDEAFRCLKKDGIIICLGPNIRYVLGSYWDYWDHYIPITDSSMAEVLKLRGFAIKEVVPRFLPYTMSGGLNPPLIALKMYLHMRFIWPVFGKQFFIVAYKQ
ncbi:class I SAM-dependent methyltransferase [Methylocaldum gracile]|jgi:SAM-dependent methyltransferase